MQKSKRGQTVFGLSYGVIFSIFIIIFIIAVAFIAIRHFMGLNDCTQVSFLYKDLNDEVERAWSSGPGRYSQTFTHSVEKGIEYVCFGSLTAAPDTANPVNAQIQTNLSSQRYTTNSANVYVYPASAACDGSMYSYDLKCGARKSNCLETSNDLFFCVKVEDREVSLNLRKESTSPLIQVGPA